jgi:hypothetical protein
MAKWTAFPHDAADYTYDAAALKKKWRRLHGGDAEPLPTDAKCWRPGRCSMLASSRRPTTPA